ncbi:hypothetical protein GMD78_09185 [Ornithinibacillus sp. L9]|uniref:Uncharacterized protein n=1 Tax=Ornithinibacillus caprae TaxID=2678566 RepID=A0A6N8FFX3_9BACI|nr:hypothetical protein [Ornithinibacillus caprae]MUK88562.1 hypothetical protein [Ornithinibacillus caprae]
MVKAKEKDWSTTWTSAAGAIHGAISYHEDNELSLIDVMGLTGHAFRINIDPIEVNVAGPTSFPGGYILRRNLCNLGYISCLADSETPVLPERLAKTIALIQDSVDRGFPAICFDLFIPEFGLIYGYDDEKQEFYAKDSSQEGVVSYEKFADVKGVLFATTISEKLPHSKYEKLRMALDMIVDHTRGNEWKHIFKDKYKIGLSGYDAWIHVMEKRKADPTGNAFNVAVVSDAREFATKFLQELTLKWDGENVVERSVRELAGEAANHYAEVAKSLVEMRTLFPFPQGGNAQDSGIADQAIRLLRRAQEAEEQGVKLLERLLHFMKAYHSEKWIY